MPARKPLPEQLGRYLILSQLGEGGMGAVYLAEDTLLGRQVALKVPHFSEEEDPLAFERFRREVRLAAAIHHPNLCPVHDVGESDGVHYFTMPFIEGKPLSKLVGPGRPWSSEQALELVRKLALALAALHERGIVHRDLKPGNIMIRPGGEPVLMDFGLARSFVSASQHVTAAGTIVGTPAYMSPEQVSGQKTIGPASDIYSLGVILYQLLTGHLLFEGPTMEVFAHILNAEPEAPSQRRPGLEEFDALCLKALAKKPEDRFASMTAFAAALKPQDGSSTAIATAPAAQDPETMRTTIAREPDSPSQSRGDATAIASQQNGPGQRPRKASGGRLLWPAAALVLLGGIALGWHLFTRNHQTEEQGDPPPKKRQEEKELTNSIGMKLVLIPPGKYRRGSPMEEPGREPNEGPQHDVEITRAFHMGTTEVTVRQFRRFIEDSGQESEGEAAGDPNTWRKNPQSKADGQPVIYVSRKDAIKFCEWLSRKEDKTYELPTDAEWEYACRAGTTTRYSCGDDDKGLQEYAWFDTSSSGKTKPVGTKKPNPWGLYDMHGNVWEWCAGGNETYTEATVRDPAVPFDRLCVIRGGSWDLKAGFCRAACRHATGPGVRDNRVGFRVVLRSAPRTP